MNPPCIFVTSLVLVKAGFQSFKGVQSSDCLIILFRHDLPVPNFEATQSLHRFKVMDFKAKQSLHYTMFKVRELRHFVTLIWKFLKRYCCYIDQKYFWIKAFVSLHPKFMDGIQIDVIDKLLKTKCRCRSNWFCLSESHPPLGLSAGILE